MLSQAAGTASSSLHSKLRVVVQADAACEIHNLSSQNWCSGIAAQQRNRRVDRVSAFGMALLLLFVTACVVSPEPLGLGSEGVGGRLTFAEHYTGHGTSLQAQFFTFGQGVLASKPLNWSPV